MITINESNYVSGCLNQYSYGQTLRICGAFPSSLEVHFSLKETGGEAPRQLGSLIDGAIEVDIPNEMLRNNDTTRDYNIYVFLYIRNETSGETIRRAKIPVKSRPKPGDYIPPEQPDYGEQLLANIQNETRQAIDARKEAEEYAQSASDNAATATEAARFAGLAESNVKKLAENVATDKESVENAKNIAEEKAAQIEEKANQIQENTNAVSELKKDLAHKLDKPATAQVGQIFRVQAIREDGSLVIEAVDMPSGSSVDSDQDYWAARDISNPDFEVNLEEDAAYLFIDKINGEAFEWDECMILANISSYVTGTAASGSSFLINAKEVSGGNMKSLKVEYLPTSYGFAKMMLRKRLGVYILEYEIGDLRNWSTGQAPMKTNLKPMFGSLDIIPDFGSTIKSLCINFGTSVGIPKGMHIRIYGKPVKGVSA